MKKKWFLISGLIFISLIISAMNFPVQAQGAEDLELVFNEGALEFHTGWGTMVKILTIYFPDGSYTSSKFIENDLVVFSLKNLKDGYYQFKLVGIPESDYLVLEGSVNSEDGRDWILSELSDQETYLWDGSFTVKNESILQPPPAEAVIDVDLDENTLMDVLHYDDVIVTGSLCVGFDCVDGESFGYGTIKLKENNLQLVFEDTSTTTFPTNDWKIQINDVTSGGANYFTIWDVDGGRRPFTIEAGAPAHSLYVEDYGRVGLGTSIPYVELHIVDGDSPTIRLDQDGTSGWAPIKWDIVGNETNFFIRDVTNGSKLSFRIQPNTPSNTLALKSTGYVGIGTWSPEAKLEIETTGDPATLRLDRTDGSTWDLTASVGGFSINGYLDTSPVVIESGAASNTLYLSSEGNLGIGTDDPTSKLFVSGTTTLNGITNVMDEFSVTGKSTLGDDTIIDGKLEVSGNTMVDGNLVLEGYLSERSDVNAKENFKTVSSSEILEKVSSLPITTWNYIDDAGTTHIGPMAQDFYGAFEVGLDDKHLSAMDVNGVTLASIQELNRLIDEKETRIDQLENQLSDLQKQVYNNGLPGGFAQSQSVLITIGAAFLMGFAGMILGGLIFSKKYQK